MEDERLVEVIIPCHSAERPLERAVLSVLKTESALAEVTVVAHNISARRLAASIPPDLSRRVRWLELFDGSSSPAGPLNHALSLGTSRWVSRLDSDDWLEPGAIRSWLAIGQGMDAVVAHLRTDKGNVVRTPPIRPIPRRVRRAVQDRLFYRTAPFGLLCREFLFQESLAFTPSLRTGEDLELSSRAWAEGNVAVQTKGPGYVVGTDAAERITEESVPLRGDLAAITRAWDGGWASKLPPESRIALGTKMLRVHIFGAAFYRAQTKGWLEGDRESLRAATVSVLNGAPGCEKPLSVADRRLLDAILDPTACTSRVNNLAVGRRRFGRPETLFPRDLLYGLHREAPLRFMAASLLMK